MRRIVMLSAMLACATPSLAAGFPVTIDNCGARVTIAAPPQRVVTIKSTATEMLLALGLADRIVGVAFQDGPLPPEWAGTPLPVLAEKLPNQEVVLETEPDLVYGGWESNFSGDGAGERPALAALGVASYVSPAACRAAPYKPEKLTFDQLFGQIAEMGAIFGIEEKAEALIAQQKAALAAIVPDTGGHTALWYSSGTKAPYVGAGTGAPAMMLEALGLDNIFADIADAWVSASWESVVAADPDVIVLVDSAWNSAAQKKKLLAENPVTANLSAVKAGRYLIVPFPASEAGVRSVAATRDMAAQLEALAFPR